MKLLKANCQQSDVSIKNFLFYRKFDKIIKEEEVVQEKQPSHNVFTV